MPGSSEDDTKVKGPGLSKVTPPRTEFLAVPGSLVEELRVALASCLEFPRPQVDRCPLRDLGLLGGIRAASFSGPRLVEGKQASTAGSQPSWAPPCACSEDLQQGWRLGREDHTWNRTKPTGFPPRVQPAVILPPRNEGSGTERRKCITRQEDRCGARFGGLQHTARPPAELSDGTEWRGSWGWGGAPQS